MIYDFDHVPDRIHTESVKWRTYDPDVLPMWVADMDFPSPQPVVQALQERVAQGIYGYPKELPDFREILVDRLAQRYHWQVQPDELIFLEGVVTGFNLACHTVAEPGAGVLVQNPIYFPMLKAPANAHMQRQDMELTRLSDGSYAIDWEAFENAIDDRTRLFMLCNPHNPVGRVFREEELERMAEICLQHDITICSDEIHCDLVYSGQKHIPIASIDSEIARHTITLIAPSKTYNIAGLQCSVAIIQDPDLREAYQLARQGLVSWVNLMGMVAGRAAYAEGQEWLDQLLPYLESNRDHLYTFVEQNLPGISMAKPEGTYLAWLDCREAGIPGNPQEFFLKEGRVAFNDGKTFGQGGEGFVRLNFGCPRSMLTEALQRMQVALESHRQDTSGDLKE
jgi:cystathionine beta-lyase